MLAKHRLFITADKTRLVAEGDPDGAILYAAPGDTIPQSAVERFGLVDGGLASDAPDKTKRREDGEDKRRTDGGDKDTREGSSGTAREAPSTGSGTTAETSSVGVQPGSPHSADLTAIKGIGPATATALTDAGIDDLAALAAIDPQNPPEIGVAVKAKDWVSWTGQARVLLVDRAPETPVSGLTINKLPKGD